MQVFTLPEPLPAEKELRSLVSGKSRAAVSWRVFPSNEIFVSVGPVAAAACIIGRTAPPAENLFMTALLADTLRRNGAREITLALPYFAYGRQDRQHFPGDPFTAATVATLLAAAGVSRIVSGDVHSDRVLAASPVPIVNVPFAGIFAAAMKRLKLPSALTVVSPDRGGFERAKAFAALLAPEAKIAWIEKKRRRFAGSRGAGIHGATAGDTAIIIDDIIDTGGTVEAAAKLLRAAGLTNLHLCVSHPVFSGRAAALVKSLSFASVTLADTLPIRPEFKTLPRLRVVRSAPAIAEKILE